MAYKVGDLVWARIKGFPWWPGQVFEESSQYVSKNAKAAKRDGCQLVAFFGDGAFGWFQKNELEPFLDSEASRANGSNKTTFKKALSEARMVARATRKGRVPYPASCLLAYYNADSDEEEEFDMEDFDSYAEVELVRASQPEKAMEWLRCAARAPSDYTIKWGFGTEEVLAKAALSASLRVTRMDPANAEALLPEESQHHLADVRRQRLLRVQEEELKREQQAAATREREETARARLEAKDKAEAEREAQRESKAARRQAAHDAKIAELKARKLKKREQERAAKRARKQAAREAQLAEAKKAKSASTRAAEGELVVPKIKKVKAPKPPSAAIPSKDVSDGEGGSTLSQIKDRLAASGTASVAEAPPTPAVASEQVLQALRTLAKSPMDLDAMGPASTGRAAALTLYMFRQDSKLERSKDGEDAATAAGTASTAAEGAGREAALACCDELFPGLGPARTESFSTPGAGEAQPTPDAGTSSHKARARKASQSLPQSEGGAHALAGGEGGDASAAREPEAVDVPPWARKAARKLGGEEGKARFDKLYRKLAKAHKVTADPCFVVGGTVLTGHQLFVETLKMGGHERATWRQVGKRLGAITSTSGKVCKDKFHAYKFVELEQKCVKKYGSGEGGDDAAAGRGADKSHDENRTSDDGILDQRKSDDVPADREGTPELAVPEFVRRNEVDEHPSPERTYKRRRPTNAAHPASPDPAHSGHNDSSKKRKSHSSTGRDERTPSPPPRKAPRARSGEEEVKAAAARIAQARASKEAAQRDARETTPPIPAARARASMPSIVQEAFNQRNHRPSQDAQPRSTTVYMEFPLQIPIPDEHQLRASFRSFGVINRIHVDSRNRTASVDFKSYWDCDTAYLRLRGKLMNNPQIHLSKTPLRGRISMKARPIAYQNRQNHAPPPPGYPLPPPPPARSGGAGGASLSSGPPPGYQHNAGPAHAPPQHPANDPQRMRWGQGSWQQDVRHGPSGPAQVAVPFDPRANRPPPPPPARTPPPPAPTPSPTSHAAPVVPPQPPDSPPKERQPRSTRVGSVAPQPAPPPTPAEAAAADPPSAAGPASAQSDQQYTASETVQRALASLQSTGALSGEMIRDAVKESARQPKADAVDEESQADIGNQLMSLLGKLATPGSS